MCTSWNLRLLTLATTALFVVSGGSVNEVYHNIFGLFYLQQEIAFYISLLAVVCFMMSDEAPYSCVAHKLYYVIDVTGGV